MDNKNNRKSRKFKISMISDKCVTYDEFEKFKLFNCSDQSFKVSLLNEKKKKLRDALSFLYNREEMN